MSLRFDSLILDTPGQIIRLGFSPFHAHTTYQVEIAEGVEGDFFVTFKITSSAPFYLDSAEYTLLLSNEEEHHDTTTTTLGGEPICGDGFLSAGEACDDGDTDWVIGAILPGGLHDDRVRRSGRLGERHRRPMHWSLCARPSASGAVTAASAMWTTVAARPPVSASDALRVLRVATGAAGMAFSCPTCG